MKNRSDLLSMENPTDLIYSNWTRNFVLHGSLGVLFGDSGFGSLAFI